MSINRNNYEVYLIDYLDGKLTPNQVADVLLFLEKNLDLKEEFEGINEVDLVEEYVVDFNSNFLMKNQHERNDYLLINELEGTLTIKEKAELNQYLSNQPELVVTQKLFSYTISKPDLTSVFPNKSSLKKGTLILAWYKPLLRIAAILILIGSIGFGWYKSTKTDKKIAEVNTPSTPIKPNIILPPTPKLTSDEQVNIKVLKQPHQSKNVTNNIVKKSTISNERINLIEANIVMQNIDVTPILQPVYAIANKTAPIITNEVIYDDVRTLAIKRIKQNANKLMGENDLNKDLKLVEVINKTTGAELNIKRDTTTGRINKFEIAALGIAWSR